MKMPEYMPSPTRVLREWPAQPVRIDGLTAQGCSPLQWVGCAAQIAACTAATGGVGLVACLAAAAPNCISCVS
jgi:hypothetical protein